MHTKPWSTCGAFTVTRDQTPRCTMAYVLKISGEPHTVDADRDTPLLWVLRDMLQMTGTKLGCGMELCGACTVHLEGAATSACITPIDSVGRRPRGTEVIRVTLVQSPVEVGEASYTLRRTIQRPEHILAEGVNVPVGSCLYGSAGGQNFLCEASKYERHLDVSVEIILARDGLECANHGHRGIRLSRHPTDVASRRDCPCDHGVVVG